MKLNLLFKLLQFIWKCFTIEFTIVYLTIQLKYAIENYSKLHIFLYVVFVLGIYLSLVFYLKVKRKHD